MVRHQVIGSGMLGSAFSLARGTPDTIVYAAGTSNSSCTRQSEFDRDRSRLTEALLRDVLFIYISTCSVEDKPYTHHKLQMEELVKTRGDYLIVRLPIVAGRSTNPHTLLNLLYDRISRSEEFDLFVNARRNIIDVADVVTIVNWLARNLKFNETVNVAAPNDYSIMDIVRAMEQIIGKRAIFTSVDSGDSQIIDTRRIADADVDFSGDYLGRTLSRYYS